MRIRRLQERRLGFSNVWYNINVSLYLEQEVRIDEGRGRQLAAGTGVVTRPGLVARAGDRRLLTGELLRWSEYFCYLLLGLLSRERTELTSE